MCIRRARATEARQLTNISFASKKYWRYPEAFFTTWKNELTITPQYITDNLVFVCEIEDVIVGYYSLVDLRDDLEFAGQILEKGCWLDHMFIVPTFIGKSLGTRLFEHARHICTRLGILQLQILADPNARGFYEKLGCRFIREFPSTIANRTTPLLEMNIAELSPDGLVKSPSLAIP